MEDMPIGSLENIVRELEADPNAVANRFGIFRCECGRQATGTDIDDRPICTVCRRRGRAARAHLSG